MLNGSSLYEFQTKKGDRVRSFGVLFGFQVIGRGLKKRIWAAGLC